MEEPQSKEPASEAVTPALPESPRPEGREEQPRPSPEETQQYRFDGQETKGSKFVTSSVSDFSDPVYKEIAITNGCINRMSKEELRAKLSEFKLETRGVKDVLKKRLKNYYKKQKLMLKESNCADSYYDYICIIDFEATCEEGNPPEFVHEIIEFPVVLLNTHTLEIEDTFQQYVRPEINTQLSDFCISLTGITQDQVDRADTFPQVLKKVIDWMKLKELGTKYKYSILTDGSWDMSKFFNIQCQLSRLKYPPFAKKWINIRKSYGNFYKDRQKDVFFHLSTEPNHRRRKNQMREIQLTSLRLTGKEQRHTKIVHPRTNTDTQGQGTSVSLIPAQVLARNPFT
ncbi:3'-5' exoribonuclease 1 isoform X3 [Piliocolobus tephrosceles]|uniref:3'-5' exoribonuclease 1 isoform X3 n=1 Tax=Piliocolobus tephrosceles TaxID=591936 RepID=UPI000C29DBEE|nr:3'-5' exoribonuclease 1 isoform X3 [Piliocolobus tephrosceles]